jgi:hypothetical protein
MNSELDKLILESTPYFIAVEYRRLLNAETFEDKTRHAMRVYELGLRGIAIITVSQYLIRDAEKISDPTLNHLLLTKLPFANLTTWQQILFTTLKTYERKRPLFFMPELYDFYWDTDDNVVRPNLAVESLFERLTQVYNDLNNRVTPTTETDWQELYDEVIDLLRTVLSHFTFFQNYELIRITKNSEKHYWYDLYKGQTVVTVQDPIEASTHLGAGWFYISKQHRDFLSLHPLLVFWEESAEDIIVGSPLVNTAIYERFADDTLHYLITSLWKKVTNDESVVDFVRMLYYVIQQVKAEKQQAERLTWWKFQEVAHKISDRRMSSVSGKFRADLYLQRNKTKDIFEQFLRSDKTCFVLTGKSGVGKSNFLFSLSQEYKYPHPTVSLLMYNGAKLDSQKSITALVSQDFDDYLSLSQAITPGAITNIWQEIATIEESDSRTVILCIDAINENPEARQVLKEIDDLVERSPWPWLKILVTSRPEAWQTMKRGLSLAETRYYYEEGSDDRLSIEMESFSYSLELAPFEKDELPLVYEKYRQAYNLLTDYTDLPTTVKMILRDPLVLRLMADIYQDTTLPRELESSQIYQSYIDSLLKTERLEQRDLHFLESELIERMIDLEHFTNRLTLAEIGQARTKDGRTLFDLIHDDGLLSTGRRVNQSYLNLLDSEILVRLGEGRDYEIAFKFERFYDYFTGKRLYILAHREGFCGERYMGWVKQIQKHPYLWGGVRSALITELIEGNDQLVVTLCQTELQAIKEMMVAVIIEYGKENLKSATYILQTLAQLGKKYSRLDHKITFWKNVEPPKAIINAHKIVIEVATSLGLISVLEEAAASRSATIRTHAVKNILHLWRLDKTQTKQYVVGNRGFSILKTLASQVRPGLVPNIHVVESCVGIILSIFAETHDFLLSKGDSDAKVELDDNLAYALRDVSKQIMDDLLYIGKDGVANAVIRNQIRDWVVSTLVSLSLGFMGDTSTSSPSNIRTFFKLPSQDKEVLRSVIRYFNTDYGDFSELENVLPRLIEINEGAINFQLWLILLAQWENNKEAVLKTVTFLFEQGIKYRQVPYACTVSLSVLMSIMIQQRGDEDLGKTLFDWLLQFLEKSRGRVVHSAGVFVYPLVASYIRVMHANAHKIDISYFRQVFERAAQEQDTEFAIAVVQDLSSLVTQREFHKAVMEVVDLLRTYRESNADEHLYNLLARLRQYNANWVDDYMLDADWSDEEQRIVKNREFSESIGADLLYMPLYYFVANSASFSPYLQKVCQEILEKLLDCRTFEEFLNYLIRKLLNLAYGETIFEI